LYLEVLSLEQNLLNFIHHLRPYKDYDLYESLVSCSSKNWAAFVTDTITIFGKIDLSNFGFCGLFSELIGIYVDMQETGNRRMDKLDPILGKTMRLLAHRVYSSSPVILGPPIVSLPVPFVVTVSPICGPTPVLCIPVPVVVLSSPVVVPGPVLSVPCSFSVEVSPPFRYPLWSFVDAPFGCGWSQSRKRLCATPCALNVFTAVPSVVPVPVLVWQGDTVPVPVSPSVPTTPVLCSPLVGALVGWSNMAPPQAICVPSPPAYMMSSWYSFVPSYLACFCGPGSVYFWSCTPLVPPCSLFVFSGNGPGPPSPLLGPCNTRDPPWCVFWWFCSWCLFPWLLLSLPLGLFGCALLFQFIDWSVLCGTLICFWVRSNFYYSSLGIPSKTSSVDAWIWVSLKPLTDCHWSLAVGWCILLLGEKKFICFVLGVPSFNYLLDTSVWASFKPLALVVGYVDELKVCSWVRWLIYYSLGLG